MQVASVLCSIIIHPCLCFLCVRYCNFFSLLTSINLLIKLILIFSKKPVLLEWTHPVWWYLLILIVFTLILCNISFTFGFPFSFNLYLLCKLSWCLFFIFLPTNNAFRLHRSLLSSLTRLSSLLFLLRLFLPPFVFFFANTLVTNAAPR